WAPYGRAQLGRLAVNGCHSDEGISIPIRQHAEGRSGLDSDRLPFLGRQSLRVQALHALLPRGSALVRPGGSSMNEFHATIDCPLERGGVSGIPGGGGNGIEVYRQIRHANLTRPADTSCGWK